MKAKLNTSPKKIMNNNCNINSNNNSNDKSYYFYLKKSSQVINQNNDSSFSISKGPVSYRPTQKFHFDERKNSDVSGNDMSPLKFQYYLDNAADKRMMTDTSIINDDISKDSALDISSSNIHTKYIKSHLKESKGHNGILNMTATNSSAINTSTLSSSLINSSKKTLNPGSSTIAICNRNPMKPYSESNNPAERLKNTINTTSTQAVYNKIYESKGNLSTVTNKDESSPGKLNTANKRHSMISNINARLNKIIENHVSTNNIPHSISNKTNNLNHIQYINPTPTILLQNIINNERKNSVSESKIISRRPSQNLYTRHIKDEGQNHMQRKFSKNDESNTKLSPSKDRMPLETLETNNNYDMNYRNYSDENEDSFNISATNRSMRKSLESRSKQVTSASESKGYSYSRDRERIKNIQDNTLVDSSLFKDKVLRGNDDVRINTKQNSPVFHDSNKVYFLKNQPITPVKEEKQEQSNNKEKDKIRQDRSNSNKNSHRQKSNAPPRYFKQTQMLSQLKKDTSVQVENPLLKKKQEKLNGIISIII